MAAVPSRHRMGSYMAGPNMALGPLLAIPSVPITTCSNLHRGDRGTIHPSQAMLLCCNASPQGSIARTALSALPSILGADTASGKRLDVVFWWGCLCSYWLLWQRTFSRGDARSAFPGFGFGALKERIESRVRGRGCHDAATPNLMRGTRSSARPGGL